MALLISRRTCARSSSDSERMTGPPGPEWFMTPPEDTAALPGIPRPEKIRPTLPVRVGSFFAALYVSAFVCRPARALGCGFPAGLPFQAARRRHVYGRDYSPRTIRGKQTF